MKKILLVFLVCNIYSTINAQQAYRPMIKEGAHWVVEEYNNQVLWNIVGMHGYHIKGDTTFNGIDYKKMYYRNYFIGVNDPTNNPPPFPIVRQIISDTLFALVREDTLERKVYCIRVNADLQIQCIDNPTNPQTPTINQEFPLFNFDLQPGDTLKDICNHGAFLFDSLQHIMVDTIEQQYFSPLDTIAKIFSFKNNFNTEPFSLIEGFGLNKDFFFPTPFEFYNTSIVDYCVGTDAECNEFWVHTKNIITENITVYPIPAHDVLTIDLKNQQFKTLNISIFNLLGQSIFSQSFDNPSNIITLNINNDLSKGSYFLKIENSESLHQILKISIF